jgi:hypothetical protein
VEIERIRAVRARPSARASIPAAVLLVAGLALALAGCAGPDAVEPEPGGNGAAATASPAPGGETPAPSTPGVVDVLARFDEANLAVIAADASPPGRAFVDALAEAGFDRAAMELTSDTTTLGEPADSIQFAVRIGDRCLIGQYGPGAGGYRSAERPGLGTGGCLVGATVPIGG